MIKIHPALNRPAVVSALLLTIITTAAAGVRFDFDGDRRADLSVFRPSDGKWYFLNSGGTYRVQSFGAAGDEPVAADYDGDGRDDIAVYRGGVWYRLESGINAYSVIGFGEAADIPVPADFDGDGKADIAVFRPSNGTWYSLRTRDQSYSVVQYGSTDDVPLPADYDGDGKADLNVFRVSDNTWYRINSGSNTLFASSFGAAGDIPVRGDFDGDGRDDLAVWRPSTGVWFIRQSLVAVMMVQVFGVSTDVPVPADYDGDGKTDIAVFRPSNGNWYRLESSGGGYRVVQFGVGTDVPVPIARTRPASPPNSANCTWFVATGGSRTNAGTQASPWNLAHAVSGANGAIKPGNTVCIMGGTYPGRFRTSLAGAANNPVVLRSYPGQRVVIDGGLPVAALASASGTAAPYGVSSIALSDTSKIQVGTTIRIGTENMQVNSINYSNGTANVVRGWGGSCPTGTCQSWPGGTAVTAYYSVLEVAGSNTWIWGLEVTNTAHVTRVEAPSVELDNGGGIFDSCTSGCKFINNVVHNTGGGIGSFNNSNGSEYYGNIIFLNGWDATYSHPTSPGRGHGLYLQNSSPTSPPKRVADNISFFNFGFNSQAYTDQGGIHNMEYVGNVFFESSNPILLGPTFNFLIGGGNTAFEGARFISNLTYNPTINGIRRGTDTMGWGNSPCTAPVVQDNYLASADFDLSVNCTNPTMTGNTLYSNFTRESSFPNNTYHHSRPTANRVFVRANTYERGRGYVVVYNWTRAANATVDLGPLGLTAGQRFQIRDVQNFNGPAVVSGTYSGSPVSIPLTSTAAAPVFGTVNKQPTHSDIEFGAFVVLPY